MNRAALLVPIFVALSSCWVGAQDCEVDSGFRGGHFHVGYEQRNLVKIFRNLDYMPQGVRARLEQYLHTKLGLDFAGKLKFEQGQWLNLVELKKQFPAKYEENAGRGSFYLLFSFSNPAKGIKAYFSRMVLNDDGSVNLEIGLPDIGTQPNKAEIISCWEAHAIAESRGFPEKWSDAIFMYSDELKAFVWDITDNREVEPDDPLMRRFKGTYRHIEINANTGTVVRIYKETIVI